MEIHKQAFKSGLVFADDKDQKKPKLRPNGWPPYLGKRGFFNGSVLVVRRPAGEEIVVLLGGCDIPNYVPCNSVVCFNVQNQKWQEGPCMHENRYSPASVFCNNAIYVIGGDNGSSPLDTIERIEVEDLVHSSSASINDTIGWKKLDFRLITPRFDCTAAVVHGRFIVVAGGRRSFSPMSNLSLVEIIDTASGNPCSIISGPSLQESRCCFGMGVVGARIYVVGGIFKSSVEYLDLHDLFNDSSPNAATSVVSSTTRSWTIHKKLRLNSVADILALVQVGSCLIATTGYKYRSQRTVQVLDTVNNMVWELPNALERKFCCNMVALSNGIAVMTEDGSARDTFQTLSLVDKNSWLFAGLLSIGKVSTK